jgi:transposase, IS6 family
VLVGRRAEKIGLLTSSARHVRYLNNGLEADHGALKRLINPTRGFKVLPTVFATTKGLEAMRMIRKRQCVRRRTSICCAAVGIRGVPPLLGLGR